ncbi:MAG: slipin family protein [Alphaproteobacteria bacterium]|nr:slipin family protein [Alphaproteobacteria bacterium]
MHELSGVGDFSPLLTIFGIVGVVLLFIIFRSFRILWEFERGVVFTLGRFWKIKGPGLILVFPGIQKMTRVDLRVIVLDIPTQEVISRDNVSLQVNAVLYFRVIDPQRAIINVEDFFEATSQLAQTTLRSVLGQHELDVILAEREKLNTSLQRILDEQTETWGIKVSNVEIKQVDLNESMIRAIAKQAEAERDRRAKIIHAEGELQASDKLLKAAQTLAKQPQTMVLRYLQTLGSIAEENNSTIVFPLPIELMPMIEGLTKNKKE